MPAPFLGSVAAEGAERFTRVWVRRTISSLSCTRPGQKHRRQERVAPPTCDHLTKKGPRNPTPEALNPGY